MWTGREAVFVILDPAAEAWDLGAPPPTVSRWVAASTGDTVLAVGDGRALSFTPPRPAGR